MGALDCPGAVRGMTLNMFDMADSSLLSANYSTFVVTGLVERLLNIYCSSCIFGSTGIDEMVDGIVYSVFISLGFATVENMAYVLSSSFNTAL